MTDRLTRRQRSALMARIRFKNTAPELVVRRLAHSLGYRYRLHVAKLPGTPAWFSSPARRSYSSMGASGIGTVVRWLQFQRQGLNSGCGSSRAMLIGINAPDVRFQGWDGTCLLSGSARRHVNTCCRVVYSVSWTKSGSHTTYVLQREHSVARCTNICGAAWSSRPPN
jgi:hypothetical protein